MIPKFISWFDKHNKVSWIITLFIAIAIFYVSTLTFPGEPGKNIAIKSITYHFSAFFFLALFLLISLLKGKIDKPLLFLGILFAVLYGVSDEIHQLFVPGRYLDIKDILTNSSGILSSVFLYLLSIKYRNNV